MFCAKCGNDIIEGDVFCRKCGTAAPREGEPPVIPPQEASPVQPEQQASTAPMAPEETTVAAPESAFGGDAGAVPPVPPVTEAEAPTDTPQPTGQTYTAPGPALGQPPYAQPQDSGAQTGAFGGQPPYAAQPGAPAQPAPMFGEAAPAYAVGQPDAPKKNRFKLPIIIAAILLVVAILAVLLVPKFLASRNPTTYVFGAFAKTFTTMGSEWKDTSKTLGLDGFNANYKDGNSHSRFAFEVSGIDDTIDRLGISLEAWEDREARRMEGTAGVAMSGISFAELDFGLQDNVMWAEMPSLFAGTYGVDTETIGADVDDLFGGYGFYEDISFNWYDLLEQASDAAGVDVEAGIAAAMMHADTIAKTAELWLTFQKDIDTTKMGKTSVRVNGYAQDADEYFMVVPGDVIAAYLRGVAKALVADRAFMEAMDEAMGAYSSYDYYMSYYTSADLLEELVEEIADMLSGGIKANIYIKNGCVIRTDIRFIPYEADRGYGSNYTTTAFITMEFGGKDNLIDAMTFTVGDESDDWYDIYIVEWKGQHVPVDGVFTSNLTFTNTWSDYEDVYIDASLSWDSKGDYNNFSFSYSSPESYSEPQVTARGTLAIDGGTGVFDMKLDRISYSDYWGDEYTFALDYFTEPLSDYTFGADKTPTMLFQMSESQLDDLYSEITKNAMLLFMQLMF